MKRLSRRDPEGGWREGELSSKGEKNQMYGSPIPIIWFLFHVQMYNATIVLLASMGWVNWM